MNSYYMKLQINSTCIVNEYSHTVIGTRESFDTIYCRVAQEKETKKKRIKGKALLLINWNFYFHLQSRTSKNLLEETKVITITTGT